MSGNTNYSKQIRIILLILSIAQFQCGGKQNPASAPCDEAYNRILNKNDEEVCDPARMSLFEIQVTKWRDDCPEQARGLLGKKVSDKLTAAQECSEKRRRLETKRNDCRGRLDKVGNGLSCLGEECAPHRDNLTKIATDCSAPELKGAFSEKIKDLQARIEERFNDADRLQALDGITALCDEYVEITGGKQAMAAYNRILQEVTADLFIRQVPKEGSEAGRLRKEALESCDRVLLLSLEILLPAVSKNLDGTISSKRRKRETNKLIAMYKRMAAPNGAVLFPKAAAPLEKAIQQYAPQEKIEAAAPESADKKEEKAKSTPPSPAATEGSEADTASGEKQEAVAAERTPEQDRDFLKNSNNRCRTLKKNSAHFSAKVAAYQKKGNQSKTSAYQAKLDKVSQEIEALNSEIKKTAESTALPKEESEQLLKSLKESGCLME